MLDFIESILFKDMDMTRLKEKVKELQSIRNKKVSEIQSNLKVVENLISEQSLPTCKFPLPTQDSYINRKIEMYSNIF